MKSNKTRTRANFAALLRFCGGAGLVLSFLWCVGVAGGVDQEIIALADACETFAKCAAIGLVSYLAIVAGEYIGI